MANTVLQTRIQLKYDTYTNWQTNNPVLRKGELGIAEVPAETGATQGEPAAPELPWPFLGWRAGLRAHVGGCSFDSVDTAPIGHATGSKFHRGV